MSKFIRGFYQLPLDIESHVVLCAHYKIIFSALFLSGDLVVITQMNLSSQRGHAVGISLGVILVIAGAICLGAFLLFRRHQKKNRSEALLQASEEDRAQMELEADSTKSGSNQMVRSFLLPNRRKRRRRFDTTRTRCEIASKHRK